MLEQRLTDAADGVKEALGDLVPPPVTDFVGAQQPGTPRQTDSSPMWRGPMIAVGTAIAIIAVVGVSLLVIRSGDLLDIADEPTATTVLEPVVTTTVVAPTTTVPPPDPTTTLSPSPAVVEQTGTDVIDTPPIRATWTLEATVDGWLTEPVAHSGGFLAIHKGLGEDAEPNAEGHVQGWIHSDLGGQLWESADGVTWVPAGDDQELPQPPTGESANGASVIVEARREPDEPIHIPKDLLATSDGSIWREINLRPYKDNWVPRVAEGELGWLVYSPPMAEGFGWSRPRDSNHGLWYTPDTEAWFEVADLGPLVNYGNIGEIGVLDAAMIVRDDAIIVFAHFAEAFGFGGVSQLRTEVWRLGLDT